MVFKWDGHTHTKFCRHGCLAEQEEYIERAIELGFQRYTLSEHPPLPKRWVDNPKLMEELAMDMNELPGYLDYAERIKDIYEGRIEITVGLEMDYLDGHEAFSDGVIEAAGDRLEDVIVSVHYLPGAGGVRCVDFTPADFRDGLLAHYGSMDAVVNEYYDHVERAIAWASRLPMRKRLGHVNLIEKFYRELPPISSELIERRLRGILPKLAAAGLGIDANVAGLRVASCGKPFVPDWFLRECRKLGIACVYGSDAHRPEHVGTGWSWFEERLGKPLA